MASHKPGATTAGFDADGGRRRAHDRVALEVECGRLSDVAGCANTNHNRRLTDEGEEREGEGP